MELPSASFTVSGGPSLGRTSSESARARSSCMKSAVAPESMRMGNVVVSTVAGSKNSFGLLIVVAEANVGGGRVSLSPVRAANTGGGMFGNLHVYGAPSCTAFINSVLVVISPRTFQVHPLEPGS